MAGTAKFESSSVSPEDSSFSGSYSNGKANYLGRNLDRSGSFREGSEGRSFSSATGISKVNATGVSDLPPLSQYINLEHVTLWEQKYTRAGELRRALGFTFGNVSEDNSFGAAHAKPPLTLATDDLKRFKSNVAEGYSKARKWVKKWDESLNKLNKYSDILNSKKQQTNERSCGSNFMKMGTLSHRSSPDLATQKLEERSKSIVLNKRARTAIGEMRAEGRSNGVLRQHLVVGKDKDAGKEGSFDLAEENIRKLPAGGEGWDKKMKRKRSVSTVIHRQVDADGEVKRMTMHGRLGNDSSIQASDSHSFRSGPSNGASGLNKLDGATPSASMAARMMPKNESEKTSLAKELTGVNKERLLQKGNAKLNMREDNQLFSPSSVIKGKASRPHRTGPSAAVSCSSSFSQLSVTPEDCEQPLNVNKVHSLAGVNNRKRPLPAESSSPPMAQWAQRPQKISRNRRTNIVSPMSNHDEVLLSPEGCASECGARIPCAINGSLPVKNMPSSLQPLKVKFENAPSKARLSESEENSAIENIQKDKTLGSEGDEKDTSVHQHFSPSGLFTKKGKLVAKEEIGDGVHGQGRTGRGALFSRGSVSPMRDKLENPSAGKPVRSSRPGSEKNGSKSGRPPLKKHSDRKGFTRLGTVLNSNSPDFTGESDDDREELLQAAQFACNASYNFCSSSFWKKMEPVFYVRPEGNYFLEEQIKSEHQPSISGRSYLAENVVNNDLHNAHSHLQSLVSEESKSCMVDNGLAGLTKVANHINQHQDHDSSFGETDSKKGFNNLTPLYQRVLSALIVEDEFLEEYEGNNCGTNVDSMLSRSNPLTVVERISCNGYATHNGYSNVGAFMHEEMEEAEYAYSHRVNQTGSGPFQCDTNRSVAILADSSYGSSFECQYGQMCVDKKLLIELHSIGLYPEAVPDLAEEDDESINQDIAQLKKQLSHQAAKKMVFLDKIHKTMAERKEAEGRELEQVAMNRLTELAYRKLLATRGSTAARMGISKVAKHVALAFVRRTLARCRMFEGAGKSCFTEPALRDVLFAVPSITSGFNCISLAAQNARTSGSEQSDLQNDRFDTYETHSHQSDHVFAKNGPVLNRGRKKEVLLEDVGGNASMRSSNLGSNLLGAAKGKRSDRDFGAKAGRPSISNLRGERKTKAKPKQKATPMTTHPVQPSASEMGTCNKKRDGLILPGNILDSSVENKDSMDLGNLPLHELDSIDDLGVVNEFEGHQDLSSWLNFDEVDGLQDHDSMGLEIPMDDLSDLNMLL